MATMLFVIFLEIIVRLLHEASYLATQQHLSQDVTAVIKVLGCRSVTYSQRDCRACSHRVLHREMYGIERLISCLDVTKMHIGIIDVLLMTDETKPVAIHATLGIINRYLSHTSWKRIRRNAYLRVLCTELLEVMQSTSHHDCNAQSLVGCLATRL